MISFSIGELKCPSLDYVYDMTWAEYRIRSHSYNREKKRELFLLRELAWVTYLAPNIDPKKMKKNINSFWDLGDGASSNVTEAQINRIREAQEQYKIDLDNNLKKAN